MKLARESDTVTIYVKRPFKHNLPRSDDVHSKKNPFRKSSQDSIFQLSKSSTMSTFNKSLHECSNIILTTEVPSPQRAEPVRIPLPSNDVEEIEEPLTDDEVEEKEETSAATKFKTETTKSYNFQLTREVAFHFNTMRSMPFTLSEEIALRSIQLQKTSKKKTLVLDMDDTLVHTLVPTFDYSKLEVDYRSAKTVMYRDDMTSALHTIKVIIRPYAVKLLQELSRVYEVVIFTAAEKCYADAILDVLDAENKYISYRIYRENCIIKDKYTLKDLRIFKNRSLNDLVIVDNTLSCFAEHLDNGIHVSSYFGEKGDNCLLPVLDLLKEIADCTSIAKELIKRIGLRELYNDFIKNN